MTTEFLEHYYPLERQYPTIKEIPEEELRSLRKKYNHHHQLDNNQAIVDRKPVKRAKELQQYWNQGLTSEAIGAKMGLSRNTVQGYLSRMRLVDHKQFTIKITRRGTTLYAGNIRNVARMVGDWGGGNNESHMRWLKKRGWVIEFGHWNETEVG